MKKATTFSERVQNVVRNIPKGETRSYTEVATAAGSPGAARAVGTIMRNNYLTDVPCHRVVKSDGSVGEYNRGGAKKKRAILKQEGVLAM
ncbi:6-O-methylguanine DNA methyltransferase [bacterium]|nr:6-O-methylguanine DNA methyltransferase [bacterium]|tara:strand:- start:19502 stop:19771 length:270 start_codon:yes stop_codon:yes gene_type:complete